MMIPIRTMSMAYQVQRQPKQLLLQSSNQQNLSTQGSATCKTKKKLDSVLKRINKLGKSADKIIHAVQKHVRLAVKEKLRSVGVGGMEKVFKEAFNVGEGERLTKDSCCECYLSTTAGPIAGLLFISTHKLAFCSHTSVSFSSLKGDSLTLQYYKVLIPLRKIKRVNISENVEKPSQKYIEIVTVDDFDFWFMGFLDYQKAFKRLHRAISQLP